MKRRIYFISRKLDNSNSGGILLRKKNIELLEKSGFEVLKCSSNKEFCDFYEDYNFNNKFPLILQRLGIYDDYMTDWANKLYNKINNLLTNEDIVFCTTGGELSTLKIGYLAKKNQKCKFVIHFHDPILHLKYDGEQFIKLAGFYFKRLKAFKKYLSKADLIITTSKTFYNALIEEYGVSKSKIINNYFGYIYKIDIPKDKKTDRDKINIVYGGAFQKLQSPEILAEVISEFKNIYVYYVGNYKNYEPLKKYFDKENITFLDSMSYIDFAKFMQLNADLGFVPLVGDYLKFCVPSKIYENINLGIPILGLLPYGDAMNIINENNYGKAFYYKDTEGFRKFLENLSNEPEILNSYKEKIYIDRDKWHIENLFVEVIDRLKSL